MSSSPTSEPYRVLVIGGYGFFGRRLVERLRLQPGLHVIVAGRSAERAAALVDSLRPRAQATLGAIALDAQSDELASWLDGLRVRAVVLASGPFQGLDYRVALACAAASVHYIDLADGRDFVAGIAAVDVAATAAGICVLSGASTVPALSCAAVDELTRGWQRVDWSAVPGNLQSASDRSVPVLCFRVAEPERPLSVNVRRHDVAEALKRTRGWPG